MSTTPWTDPNNPENEYDIGTIGMEPIKPDGIFGETIDAIRKYMLPFNLAYHAISAIITGGESLCPTYGLWAGAGWSGGARTSQVKWTESPCYNEIVKESSNPQDCYSLVDAIAKTHDWRYDQAEKDFPNDELNQTKAKLAADVLMLQDIMNALMYGGSYYSITGNYMGNDTWEPKLYTNTLDGTEKIFLIGLAPLFYAKIKCTEMGMEGPDNYSDQAGEMVHNILSRLPITGVFLDPFDPSKKTIYSDAYHLLIMQTDSESRCDAMIMDLNASADSKPLIVGIDYETGFTKPTDTFLINGEGVIRINGGTGNDEIKIVGEENVDNSIYKFEIVGGDGNDKIEGSDGNDTIYGGIGNDTLKGGKGNDTLYGGDGNDTYYVEADGSIDKIEDKQGINTVFISGKKITDFYWDADSSRYKSPDDEVVGVMSGTDFIVTYNGTQVILNEDFQFGDFGIDLRTPTANLTEILPPETANPIVGDYEPIDFDPDPDVTEYHYDTWGNVMVDTSKPAPGRGDTLYDTAATDKIEGKDGNDFINVSNGGNDLILGQAGNDHITVYGGSGNNILEGGDGDDYIMLYGGNNNNLIRGGVGQDNIFAGNTGENRIYGGDGNDVIDGESSAICVIEGEAGSDIIFGSVNGNNQLFGDSRSGKDMATLIADGDVALDSGVKGDIVVAGPGDNNYLYGSNGYDIMWGGYGKDLLVAGGGNDLIIGDGGNIHANWGENNWSFHIDYVDGEYTPDIDGLPDWDMNATVESDDVIYAGTGNDYVDAGGGDDEVYGGAGSDTVFGDAGHDFIEGGDGDDILAGDNGTLLAPELNGNDYIDGGAGNDAIQGDGGNDDLFGGADNDTIIGGEGDDYLDGEDGADILYGGNGKDDLFGGSENDTLYGNDGDDYLDGEAGADNLYGGIGNDVMFGDADNDTLYGMDGDDYLDGEAGLNYLYGGGGNDTIFGGDENDRLEGDHMDSTQGNDYLDGLGGDDILIGAGGADTLFGGEGNDQLHGDGAGIADGNDYLDGEGGDDAIQGYAGNDTLYGGDGNDSIWGGSENDTIYGDAGDDQLLGEYGNDYLDGGVGIDYLDGGYGDDTIYGGADDDTLIGGNGSDVYIFGMGDGSDLIWNTRTEGTIDTVKLGVNIDDVTITQNGNLIISINGTTDKLTIVNWYWDYAANVVEQFQFADDTVLTWLEIEGRIANTIYGTSGNDIIYGENSSDTIYGYEGNDVIYGGGGSNLLDGGAGNDELISNSGVNDTLIGGLGNDTMSGSGYQPVTMMGGSNDDTYRVKNNGDIVIENDYEYNGGLDLVYSDLAAYTLTANVENLNLDLNGQNGAGNDLNNVINGNANANLLAGSGGNDTLTGLDGNDTLDGGSGNDSLQGETGNDTYLFGIGSGADIVYDYDATVGNTDIIVLNNDILPTQVILNRSANDLIISIVGTTDTMTVSGWFSESAYRVEQIQFADSTIWDAPYIEQNAVPTGTEGKDVLNGTSGNDLLLGRGGNDTLYGYAGNDTLDGGSGVDKMFGGSGDDTYIIDHVRDAVTENANDGMDTVITSINYALGPNVENLTLMGGYSDLTATGNSLDNIISGNGYYDTLDGGAGADTMYGWGSDTYIVDNIGDVVIDEDGSIPRLPTSMSQIVSQEGSANVMEVGVGNEDKILSSVSYTLPNGVDVLTLTGKSAINGTGNEYSNYLTGNGGVNILTGGNGWDTLDGGAGADTLIGGFGDDTYITDNAGDVIIENADEGIDTVQSSVTYTISPNVENIILTGASRISGTGNELNNQLTGNGTVNTLTGNAGNDTLDGGLGKDSLVGGAENDTYLFRVGSGQDAVDNYDTSSGRVDTIRFMDVTSYGLRGVTQSGNDLVLEYGSTDKVTIKNFYSGSAYQVDQFTFSDNVTLSTAELLAAYGSVGSLAATKAIFTQEQTTVNSTFLNSSIHEMGYNGYIGSDLANVVRSMSNDMFSSANDGFKRMNDGTERLEVFDGHYVTRQDIENIVNTMSAINNNAGMDVMQKYNAMMQDQTYISTLAQTWKQV